ncbi:MAG: hypothetical protein ACOCY7_01930 [Halodesulfurarchaeum sp.]
MKKQLSLVHLENRQERLSALFESVTGTTVITEHQEEQVHRPHVEARNSPEAIESYLEESLASDGLEDAIDVPDLK